MDDSIRHIVEPSSEKNPLSGILEPTDEVPPLLTERTQMPLTMPLEFNTENGEVSVEFSVPPLVGWDDKNDRLICPDPGFYTTLVLCTNGDKKKIRQIVKSPKQMKKYILEDADGRFQAAIFARCVREWTTRPSTKDPYDFMKLTLEMINSNSKSGSKIRDTGKKELHVHAEGEQSKEVARQILDVAGKSDEAREEVEDEPEGD